MGREVRMVPENWEHPKDNKGIYIPLLGYPYAEQDKEWMTEWEMWQKGFVKSYAEDVEWELKNQKHKNMRYTEYAGARPSPDDYMPQWSDEEKTHLMMYENTSEGTPISPAFKTPIALARWLTDNGASAFGSMTATYEQWLAACESGFAVSAVAEDGKFKSGVEANI